MLLTRQEIATVDGKFSTKCTYPASPLNAPLSRRSRRTSRVTCFVRYR